jgi:hypothetical protein
MIGLRFNTKQATFNTLSGFFCLRFLAGAISDIQGYEEEHRPEHEVLINVIMPFVKLLQTPFNLGIFGEKSEAFAIFNHHLIYHVLPEMRQFVFSVADLVEEPVYEPPDNGRFCEALHLILNCMVKNKDKFENRYRELEVPGAETSAAGWNFSYFLMSFFKDNISE